MSTRDKYRVIEGLKQAIEGRVGEWAKEAQCLIRRLEMNLLDDKVFAEAAEQWKRLSNQMPPLGARQDSRGRVTLQY